MGSVLRERGNDGGRTTNGGRSGRAAATCLAHSHTRRAFPSMCTTRARARTAARRTVGGDSRRECSHGAFWGHREARERRRETRRLVCLQGYGGVVFGFGPPRRAGFYIYSVSLKVAFARTHAPRRRPAVSAPGRRSGTPPSIGPLRGRVGLPCPRVAAALHFLRRSDTPTRTKSSDRAAATQDRARPRSPRSTRPCLRR